MDEPVTDIVFVSSKDNVPEGYRIIEQCPCGHDAQIWEKVLGGESGERYVCFTKQDKDDMVIEDMYIPGRGAQYLYKGYKIVKETVEGDEPMHHKQLAVKKVPRVHASKVIADVIICRSRDNVSNMYKKLDKVNGLCICFRQMDLGGRNSPSPTHARRATTSNVRSTLSPSPRSQRSGSVKLEDVSQHMAGMSVSNNPSFRRASNPVLAATRVMSPLASHTRQSLSPSPQPPPHPHSPPLSSGAENPPSLVEAAPLSSPPPPSPPSSPPSTNGPREEVDYHPSAPSTQYPPPTSTASSYYPPPSTASSNYPPTAYPSNYPPPATAYSSTINPYPPPPSTATGYTPHGTSYPSVPSNPTSYPSAPPNTTYPPPPSAPTAGYGGGGSIGFGALAKGVRAFSGYQHSSYPPQAPSVAAPQGGYGGYAAVAGPSFTAPQTASGVPSGPAPYNPYQSQPGPAPYPPPPSGQPTSQRYGFNF